MSKIKRKQKKILKKHLKNNLNKICDTCGNKFIGMKGGDLVLLDKLNSEYEQKIISTVKDSTTAKLTPISDKINRETIQGVLEEHLRNTGVNIQTDAELRLKIMEKLKNEN